jgi:AAHS family 3-hydroxyphenylpropionic acid transporter
VAAAFDSGREQRAVATLVLCFLTAVIEGVDLQSMGIAAPSLGPEFRLSRQQLGIVLLASPLGDGEFMKTSAFRLRNSR